MRLFAKDKKLGWLPEEDRSYLDKYPLTAETLPSTARPVVLGIGWYSAFDNPVVDNNGRYWIGKSNLGYIRGGHAICVQPGDVKDWFKWYYWYNQGSEGACVGFSLSRAVSLMNRKTYDARWLYTEAQLIDEFEDTPPQEGTSVRAGCEILVKRGHKRVFGGITYPEDIGQGIAKYRWAKSVQDIHAVLKNPLADQLKAVPLLNSWGKSYPRRVWLPDSTLEYILFEKGGEAAILTDR
jgi:hypothetical protein